MKISKNLVMKLEISKKDDSFYFFSSGFYLEGDLRMKKIIGDVAGCPKNACEVLSSILSVYEDNLCKLDFQCLSKNDFLIKNIFSTYVERHNRRIKI